MLARLLEQRLGTKVFAHVKMAEHFQHPVLVDTRRARDALEDDKEAVITHLALRDDPCPRSKHPARCALDDELQLVLVKFLKDLEHSK